MFQSDSEDTHLVAETDETTGVKSNLCCFKRGGFSVQSGDIQRIAAEDDTDNDVQDINTLNFKERLLHRLHQIIYKVVKKFFSNPIPSILTLLFILVLIPVGLTVMAIFVYPPQLDLSLRSFQIPNHESSLNYDAFQMALHPHVTTNEESSSSSNTRHKRYLDCDRFNCPVCTESQALRKSWALNIFYVSKDGSNIVTKDRIEQIHKIEQNIMNHKHGDYGYEYFCHKSPPYERCDPLNSLLTFFYPSCNGGDCVYDGNGPYIQDVKSTLALAFQLESSYWYGDFNNISESRFLRSQLRIGVPTPNYCRFSENAEAIHKEITDYFISFIPYLDSASTGYVIRIYTSHVCSVCVCACVCVCVCMKLLVLLKYRKAVLFYTYNILYESIFAFVLFMYDNKFVVFHCCFCTCFSLFGFPLNTMSCV